MNIRIIKTNLILIIIGICLTLIGSTITDDFILTFTMISGAVIIIIVYLDIINKMFK